MRLYTKSHLTQCMPYTKYSVVLVTSCESCYESLKHFFMGEEKKILLLVTKVHPYRMAYPTVATYFLSVCFLLTVICWLYPVGQVSCEALRNTERDGVGWWASECSLKWFKIPWEQFCDRVLLVSRWSNYPGGHFFFSSVKQKPS